MEKVLSEEDFLQSFGAESLSARCMEEINKKDFRLKKITGEKRDNLIQEIIERIIQDKQVIGAPDRTGVCTMDGRKT